MKMRNMLRLLSVGTNLYLISQDKELMEKLKSYAKAGKEKYDDIFHGEDAEDESEEDLLAHLSQMGSELKDKMNEEMEAIARKTYAHLHIAHTEQVTALKAEIDALKAQIDAFKSTQAG